MIFAVKRKGKTMAEYIVNINEEEVGEFDFIAITTLKEIGIPLIRCKDCRYSYDGFKKYVCVRNIIDVSVEPYDYCSMAVRKEE